MNTTIGRCSKSLLQDRPAGDGGETDEPRRCGRPGKEGLLLKGCRTMIIESPLQLVFRDLFYRLPAFAERHDVFLKLEGFNITGSIKVKTAIGLVEDLEQRGMARPNETVLVESSSGNLGLALSLVCAIRGYKFICVTDPNANRAAIRGMELYGATHLSKTAMLNGEPHCREDGSG